MTKPKFLLAAAAVAAIATAASAQMAGGGAAGGPGGPRPMMTVDAASKDPAAAPAGTYQVDPGHNAIIARVAHHGAVSWSIFRFTSTGTLNWNPADPAQSKLAVKVDMKSVATPVPGFGDQIASERLLNTPKFPEATFTSTGIIRTGPTSGRIDGTLTFMGVTKPVSIIASLVGVGKDMRGAAAIGFTGTMTFKRSDFGFTAMQGMIGDEINLTLDVEFTKVG